VKLSTCNSWHQSSVWETIASSVINAGNPQQGGKKGKYKNKDVVALVEERLAEINITIAALTGGVDDMDKCIEELQSKADMEELRGEMQAVVNSVVADFNMEV